MKGSYLERSNFLPIILFLLSINVTTKTFAQINGLDWLAESYELNSAFGKTVSNAGDVLTYVSILLTDSETGNDELARDLAEDVNSQQMIGAGIVPDGNFLAKGGWQKINWGFDIPEDYIVFQNYPNPFNPKTTIRFVLPSESKVSIIIYDILGAEILSLIDGEMNPGIYETVFNAGRLASGVYIYRITTKS